MATLPGFSDQEHAAIRAEFPFLDERVYLNYASVGPLPLRARRVIDRLNDTLQRLDADFDTETFACIKRARAALAALVGGTAEQVGLVPNTSFGLNWALGALGLKPGDGVLITDHEFPALTYAALNLKHFDIAVEVVPVPAASGLEPGRLEELLRARPRTRVVAVSWVNFHNGFRHDLGALARTAHAHDAFLVVDAIQGLGTCPLDAPGLGVDLLAAAVHKWMLCPVGQAFVWCHPRLLDRLVSPWAGWLSVDWDLDFADLFARDKPFPRGPRSAEAGTPNFAGVRALAVTAEWFVSLGTDRIRAHTQDLLDQLDRRLDRDRFAVVSDRSEAHRSSIYCIRPRRGDAAALRRALRDAGIVAALREGAVRLSPHFPTRRSEIEQLAQTLREFA